MGHYFTNEKLDSNIKRLSVRLLNNDFIFLSDNGVFSKDKLDFGTRLFLENIGVDKISGDVLDVGCGYGAIGIVVAKLSASNVTMCDVNKRALHLCERNIKENGLTNAVAVESDCYSAIDINKKYDYILTNPPIRAGKKVVYEIVMNARNYLKDTGKLFIVVRKDQGAKSMISDLQKYYNVTIIEKENGFFVIKCELLLTS